ncbi:YraN family protein [Paenalcaligenes sp. Me131]|uniref:YraN family protein n=1 Tax=Paenalcaligenes sp. Me131 TaxID=3392636 RepID=UPI003D2CECEB
MSQPLTPAALARLAQRRILQRRTRAATQPKHPQQSPTQRVGQRYEERAAQYLRKQGLCILAHNISSPFGEIDLIATDQHTLVFVEVRYRHHTHFDGAAASVNRSKQQRIRLSASFLLSQLCLQHFGGKQPPCRFDVVAFTGAELLWIPDAFT